MTDHPNTGPDMHPDDKAVDRFAAAMKAKLKHAREQKGKGGWETARCSDDFLAAELITHLSKGNTGTFEDVANFCMMLHQRGADPSVLSLMPEAGWRDDVLRCEKCQSAATKLCQMTTHECDPMPICEDCAAEHDSIAAEINDHEMREFGGEYGMVTYHYLPLPPAPATAPDHPRLDFFRGFEACREQAAQMVEQCNREGPYEAIGAAQKIRDIPTPPHKSGYVTYAETAPDPVKAAAGVLLREWDEHGEGLQGQLVTHSLVDEGLVPDLDGAWVKLDDVTAALRALKGEA